MDIKNPTDLILFDEAIRLGIVKKEERKISIYNGKLNEKLRKDKREGNDHLRMKMSLGIEIERQTGFVPLYEYMLCNKVELDVYEENKKISGECGGLSVTELEGFFTGPPWNEFSRIILILEYSNLFLWLKNMKGDLLIIQKSNSFSDYINLWRNEIKKYYFDLRKTKKEVV